MRLVRSCSVLAALLFAVAGCSGKDTGPAKPDRSKAVGHFQEAERLSQGNRIKDALAEAQKAKEADPTLGKAYTLRADLFSRTANFREARAELLAAHKALPDDLDVTFSLLYDTMAYFPPAEAEAIARKAATQVPDSPQAHYFVGMAIANSGDPKRYPEALKEFETANRLDPSGTGTLTEMAKLHLQLGDPTRALALLESAALILDEVKKQGPMPIPILEDWTKERRAVAFWSADALRRLKEPAASKAATALANKLSAQTSELRALQARVGSDPPDPAAQKRLQEIAANGF
jgi:tetratricopeptide (TPR) repeat protein